MKNKDTFVDTFRIYDIKDWIRSDTKVWALTCLECLRLYDYHSLFFNVK